MVWQIRPSAGAHLVDRAPCAVLVVATVAEITTRRFVLVMHRVLRLQTESGTTESTGIATVGMVRGDADGVVVDGAREDSRHCHARTEFTYLIVCPLVRIFPRPPSSLLLAVASLYDRTAFLCNRIYSPCSVSRPVVYVMVSL